MYAWPFPALCRFLAVHNDTDTDQVHRDYIRVNFHSDPKQAAVWQLVRHENRKYLQIKANRAASASETVGWYMTVPQVYYGRNVSSYVGVTPHVDEALPLKVLPFHDIY